MSGLAKQEGQQGGGIQRDTHGPDSRRPASARSARKGGLKSQEWQRLPPSRPESSAGFGHRGALQAAGVPRDAHTVGWLDGVWLRATDPSWRARFRRGAPALQGCALRQVPCDQRSQAPVAGLPGGATIAGPVCSTRR
jgi:hypothetical protein